MDETKVTSLRFDDDRRLTIKEKAQIEATGHSRVGAADNRRELAKGKNNSRYLMVTGRQVHCPHPKLYQDRPRILQGAAFAYVRVHRYDIRPELLTIAGGQRSHDLPRVIEYCRNYMRVACERRQIKVGAVLRDKFIALALRDWLYKSSAQTQDWQAQQMRMRKSTFGVLYGIIAQMLANRYREACARYKQILTGTEYRPNPVKWNYGLEKRIAASATRRPPDQQMAGSFPVHAIAGHKPLGLPIIHLGIQTCPHAPHVQCRRS
jgi:hypothetical protein